MRSRGLLNAAQQRHLSITCQHIDRLLSDAAHILHEASSPSPFPRHIIDVTPAHAHAVEDHIRRLREQLVRTLAWHGLKPEPAAIPATRALLVLMSFIDIAIEELKPGYMRGSGSLSEESAGELYNVVHELRSAAKSMERYIRQEFGTDLESRLKELERTGHDVSLLRRIEEVATRHGLVEFRARIRSLADVLEDDHLEVALFGRVSSGKSSLLNALLGSDLLPVGVNPVTAVPTRLRYGSSLRASVAYSTGREEVLPLDTLRTLITEQGDPGKDRSVVRALIEVPASRLKKGIVLVDTPGLGSLARRGAAETMAYLPSCDLALLLIDSGSALNEEDIGTLRILYETGIPSLVLMSKADLLPEGDLHRVAGYIESQLERELGVKTHPHAVSALPHYSVLLDHLFERELFPRFEQALTLRKASVARKIGALRESVQAALETRLNTLQRGTDERRSADMPEIEARLRRTISDIGQQRSLLDRAFLELGERPDDILEELSDMAVDRVSGGDLHPISALELSEWTHDVVERRVAEVLTRNRNVIGDAIDTLQQIAGDLGRSEAPTRHDAEQLLRDAPRFEIDVIPARVSVGRWGWTGRRMIRSLALGGMRRTLGPALENELRQYGRALTQWGEQTTRRVEALASSYADGYRAQIQRIGGNTSDDLPPAEVEQDIALLLRAGMNVGGDGTGSPG